VSTPSPSRAETVPTVEPLLLFPSVIGDWLIYRDFPLDKEVLEVLKADDTLNRFYVKPDHQRDGRSGTSHYFQTQRYGQAPHSPKNCCRGPAGSRSRDFVSLRVPGWDAPIRVNRYVVEHGDEKSGPCTGIKATTG